MGDGGAGNWCLIESDPGVFTELIEKFGVKGCQFEEIYSLEKETLEYLKPVHGLIFLFKWVQDLSGKPQGDVVKDSRADEIFFPKQVINNACATQAILSCLLNVSHPDVELGSTLSGFKEFTSSFDAGMKGLALSNSDEIRSIHNSFARQSIFEFDSKPQTKEDDDVFHFVAYVPINGRIYELDGLQEGPLDHGGIPEGADWLDHVRPVIEQRMAKYQTGEIHFNLMAVIQDKLLGYKRQIEALSKAPLNEGLLSEVRIRMADEEEIRRRWSKENIRRRHNYLPFIIELLKFLAADNSLQSIYDKAKEKSLEQYQKKQAAKGKSAVSATSESVDKS